jgi:hypothetical protein
VVGSRTISLSIAVALVAAAAAPAVATTRDSDTAPPGSARASQDPAERSVSGWSVTYGPGGATVVWRSTRPVPLTDAPVVFQLGNDVLGTPRPAADGRTYTLLVPSATTIDERQLRVTRGGLELLPSGRSDLVAATGSTPTESALPAPTTRAPVSDVDPGVPGRYETTTSEYTMAGLAVTGLPEDVEVQGVVVRPVDTYGPRPLVLFLHGRHSTCFKGGPDGRSSGDWPCRPNWEPIPSYRGYLDAQELLASQGYVTVSIAANGINGQDYRLDDGGALARSELVRHHLDLFERWNRRNDGPLGGSLVGGVDVRNVMLVGHSRGGEGVNRAAVDSTPADDWHIDSQVLIGPTAFGRQTAPGTDTAVLLPNCDGDVFDLQGQQYVDEARNVSPVTIDPSLRSAVLVMGANHNFFNLEWTPGLAAAPAWDDWGSRDGLCGRKSPTRLSSAEQRNVGAVYIATAAWAFLDDDPAALALLDGSPARPESLGDSTTYVAALGAQRTPLLIPAPGTTLRPNGASAVVCRGYRTEKEQQVCLPGLSSWQAPHFLAMYGAEDAPPPRAIRMKWDDKQERVTVPFAAPIDLSSSTSVELRVAVDPRVDRSVLGVVIGDGDGHVAHLGSRVLRPMPGTERRARVWAQPLRVPLDDLGRVDVTDISWIRLVGESATGRVIVFDGFGRAAGASSVPAPTLPRIDAFDRRVKEGDAGTHIEYIRLEMTGPVTGDERIYVQTQDGYGELPSDGSVITLSPGQTVVEIPIPVNGDTRDDYRRSYFVTVKALSGIYTGEYSGRLAVADDDPHPEVSVDQLDRSTIEGSELRWVLELSAPSDKWVGIGVKPVDAGDSELVLADLPARFRRQHNLPNGEQQTPLSDTRLRLWVDFRPGDTTSPVILPVRRDDLEEGTESVIFKQWRATDDVTLPGKLTGLVTDA